MWSNPITTLRLWWTEATQVTRIFAAGLGLVLAIGLMTWASLREHHIPMRPQDSTVSVPAANVNDASLAADAAGGPTKTADSPTADALDKIGLMTSPEVEQLRILQSEEGRLQQILAHLDHIQSASVTISPGTRGAMFGDDVPSAASVVLFLKPGETLTPKEIIGDRALIINGVPGLAAKHLTLIDQSGTPLEVADNTQGQSKAQGTQTAAQTQAAVVQPAVVPQVTPTVSTPSASSGVVSAARQPAHLSMLGRIGLIGFVLLCLVAIWLIRLRAGQSNRPDSDSERQIEPAATVPLLARTVPEVEARTPFQFLSALPPDQIHDRLEQEHPQTVAVILAQLPKAEATSLLKGLSEHCRVEVTPRMAALSELGPNIVRTVERALARSLSQPWSGLTATNDLTERAA